MLDVHSQLAIPPETNFLEAFEAFGHGGVPAAAAALTRSPRWGDFGIPAEELSSAVQRERPESFGDMLRLFYGLYAKRRGKPRWGDKSTLYSGGMTTIARQLPEARFIHIVRDGRDVALSVTPLPFGPDTIAEAAAQWMRTIEAARAQAGELPSYTEVRYEELVAEPRRVLGELCELLELEWEEPMLEYHRSAPGRLAAELGDLPLPSGVLSRDRRLAIHRLLGSPPQTDRAGRWRREMSAPDREAFEGLAGETLEELGYEVGRAAGVLILGAARSGTSAIARTFVSGGFFAGREEELLGASPINALGHYELLAAILLNEAVLEGFGRRSWADPPSPEEQIARRDELLPRLRAVLDSLLATAGDAPVVLKDPRINCLLPLWGPVVEGVLHPVLAVRDPLAVARSHAFWNGAAPSAALAAWEVQLTLVLGWLDGRWATIVPYAELVSRPPLAEDLLLGVAPHLAPRRAALVRPAAAVAGPRPELRHQDGEAGAGEVRLTDRQAELWDYLRGLPAGEGRLAVPERLRAPSAEGRLLVSAAGEALTDSLRPRERAR